VTEATARKDVTRDIWREDLQPEEAICARTIPVLEAEAAQLEETLAQVIEFAYFWTVLLNYITKLEAENRQLQAQLDENIRAKDEARLGTLELLQILEEACPPISSL